MRRMRIHCRRLRSGRIKASKNAPLFIKLIEKQSKIQMLKHSIICLKRREEAIGVLIQCVLDAKSASELFPGDEQDS